MVLGYVKVGVQGDGGQERREPHREGHREHHREGHREHHREGHREHHREGHREHHGEHHREPHPDAHREHRRKTVRKHTHASSYAKDSPRKDRPRTHDAAPVKPHYEVIAPKPPRGLDRKGSVAPGGRREHHRGYDNEPVKVRYEVIAPKPPPVLPPPTPRGGAGYTKVYDIPPANAYYEYIPPKLPPRGVPTKPRGRSVHPGIYDNLPINAQYEYILPPPTPPRAKAPVAPTGGREQPKHHHHHKTKVASHHHDHRTGHGRAREKSPQRPKEHQEPNKKIASYRDIRILGKGGQGECRLVERLSDGRRFVKKIARDFFQQSNGKPVEAYILQDVLHQHERSIKLIEYTILNNSLITIYDFYPGGDLVSYLPRFGHDPPSERFVWWIFVQLADILAYLHEGFDHRNPSLAPPREWKPVVHCDIKPDNIFLRERDAAYPNIVLGDFGFATVNPGRMCNGTPPYKSPELNRTGNTTGSDVWALGATIHELVHGLPPVHGIPIPLPGMYSSNLNGVLSSCFERDPYHRITARQLVQKVYQEFSRWK